MEASLVVQTIQDLPTMKETWVQSLGWEIACRRWNAKHSSIVNKA